MVSTSRRNMLRLSTLSFVAPAAASVLSPSILKAQTAPSKKKASIPYSKELTHWAADHLCKTTADILHGTIDPYALRRTASALRLHASHIESVGLDAASSAISNAISADNASDIRERAVDRCFSALSGYGSDITRDQVSTSVPYLTKESLTETKRHLLRDGVTWHFHAKADGLMEVSRVMIQNNVTYANFELRPLHEESDARLVTAAWHEGGHSAPAHLLHVGMSFPTICKKVLCAAVGATGAKLIKKAIGSWEGLTAAQICASDAIGSAVIDILSDGSALVLAPLEADVCISAGIMASSATTVFTTAMLDALSDSAVGALAGLLGCPGK